MESGLTNYFTRFTALIMVAVTVNPLARNHPAVHTLILSLLVEQNHNINPSCSNNMPKQFPMNRLRSVNSSAEDIKKKIPSCRNCTSVAFLRRGGAVGNSLQCSFYIYIYIFHHCSCRFHL